MGRNQNRIAKTDNGFLKNSYMLHYRNAGKRRGKKGGSVKKGPDDPERELPAKKRSQKKKVQGTT